MNFRLLYPGYREKAVCFSYDDGVIQDKELISLFRKHEMSASFNLIPSASGQEKIRNDKEGKPIDCSYLVLDEEAVKLYSNMEVANHSLTHGWMNLMGREQNNIEVGEAKQKLESLFHQEVLGFAYPYGAYGADTLDALKKHGVVYARTTRSTYDFHAPTDWLCWHPSIHHRDPKLKETLKDFFSSPLELALCFIWGHAYEFGLDHNFQEMDEVLAEIEKHQEVAVLTCLQAAKYLQAATKVYLITHPTQRKRFVNPSGEAVYLEYEGRKLVIPAKGEVDL